MWRKGFENTKTFEVSDKCEEYLHYQRAWLQGCRNCNKVTELTNMFKERQLIGNVYQSLCNCKACGEYVVLDEHKVNLLDYFVKNVK